MRRDDWLTRHRNNRWVIWGWWSGVVIVALLLAFLTSCAATGTKIDEMVLPELVKGQTTYAEVRQRWGPPQQSALRDNGTRQVIYSYQQGQDCPTNYIPIVGALLRCETKEGTETVFEFDADGRLVSYTSMQGQTATGTGFLSGKRQ